MPLSVQAKVLRALENGEIEPLGSESVQKVDVRVIAATHRNLAEMVERKEFRQDLYFRLNVFNLGVPPLRDHPEDIAELARHFLEAFCRENGLAELAIAPSALALLKNHQWPGNVRELRNVIQRCAIVASGPAVLEEDVKRAIRVS
jgi:transcriptional regulator with GAF, ATPase, and Fis domain